LKLGAQALGRSGGIVAISSCVASITCLFSVIR
jgi:hypothetical protein